MRKLTILIVMSLVLMLPVIASATYFTDIEGNADCDGWETTFSVHFRPDLLTVGLKFTIALTDGENILYTYEYDGVIERTYASADAEFTFANDWEGYHESPLFVVVENFALYYNGVETPVDTATLEIILDCIVDTEESNWGSIKALYK